MKINGIREISYQGKSIDVNLGVAFDDETMIRWNLVDPTVQIVYTTQGQIEMDYMELIDQGLIVHSFELSEEEIKQINEYVNEHHIEDKILKQLS
ncbi:hypothetical protein [Geosporobacter ferrireducens]|uniref:Uncharacterized protein n=1 Tax=Geosporobacter ferrireducens TaxID=1424294 RepID=A0A1D8GPV9_9FIRM|nr:hypothetical protein [Geosporobacter ferrireducens]AOT72903.1 hypothetical protein Gferi_27105 [Geosporobacter ferrireducens]MTI55309.1 hypothetical protein [Geosporobacter ferrireducens]